MSTSYWLDKSKEVGKKNYDVVVIGAGISGLSTAYWLNQEDPNLKVAIVEKHQVGSGATGRNAGFVTCGSVEHFNRMVGKFGEKNALDIWNFAEENLTLLKDHIIKGDNKFADFVERGTYSLAAEEAEFKELKEVAKLMEKFNIPVESFNQQDIEKQVGAKEFVGGIKYMRDAEVDPVRLLQQMQTRFKADIFENTQVIETIATDGGTRIVRTDNGDFECDLVVACANGYSPTLSKFFDEKIYPTRGQILVTEPCPQFMDAPCYANFYLDYFRQLPTGEVLIGGFRQLEKETETGYSDHITDVIQDSLHNFINKHLPSTKDKKILHRWSGVMGFSQDGNPMVGSLPDDNQFFFVGGYTGHGIGMAFRTCKSLVDCIFGKPIPEWLTSRRF